ncbi:hypothetical protein QNE64_002305 [Vibrio vulnificus]|nr:hypothetical protein [Vibrio vulnificus]
MTNVIWPAVLRASLRQTRCFASQWAGSTHHTSLEAGSVIDSNCLLSPLGMAM